MKPTLEEKSLYGEGVQVLNRRADRSVYQITDETGNAKMISYEVFEGITVVYNEVHMQEFSVDINPSEEVFEINHCREGRIECEFQNGDYLYMADGDFSVNRKEGTRHHSYFPISHYHGVSITVVPKLAQRELDHHFGTGQINLEQICRALCGRRGFFLIREPEWAEHIFFELYCLPEQIRKDYFKLKVLEVLLFLSTIGGETNQPSVYFPRGQVEKIKIIQKQITEHMDKKYTLEQLAAEHEMALTAMKSCFKGVFGSGIYSYIKRYRMSAAAKMLLETEHTILHIANCVGYENGSKFAAAFKDVMGMTPREFRQNREGKQYFLHDKMSEWS
ncbi:helix-turn-helix domain-containing protein [Aminipila luticellarii]|uniref:AraC family transcriptional regulator n=1 Tax=Aminipila luticellarii TaxID=2507160 RepID=A0A410PVG0_9FIRM|nr:AraC family transcriptional regulator [Aminipila luticellarii]QAT42932.1 AraC family transcriptional regulator [Aminipila luticellarii]